MSSEPDPVRALLRPEAVLALDASEARYAAIRRRAAARRRRHALLAAAAGVFLVAGAGTAVVATLPAAQHPSQVAGVRSTRLPAGRVAGRLALPGAAAAFSPSSLTWVSDQVGWAFGSVPCRTGRCAAVLQTRDSGLSWLVSGAPPVAAGPTPTQGCAGGGPCVSDLRYANAAVAYAYGPDLYMTRDAGQSWQAQPLHGVLGLEPGGHTVVAVSGAGAGGGCLAGCRVEVASTGSASWDVALTLTGRTVELVRSGADAVYAAALPPLAPGQLASAVVQRSLDGGRTWSAITDPCASAKANLTALASDGANTAVICVNPVTGVHSLVVTLAESPSLLTRSVSTTLPSTVSGLAQPVAGTVVEVAAGALLDSRQDGRAPADALRLPADVGEVSWLGFESTTVGHAILGNDLLATSDSGRHWTNLGAISPAR